MKKAIITLFCLTLFSLALSSPLWAAGPVNINTADATTLADGLQGVGASKAKAIIDYRDTNGPFADADQLVNVKGIGLATVNRNREVIVVEETGGE